MAFCLSVFPAGLLSDDDDVPIINLDNVTISTVVGEGDGRKNVGGTTKVLQTFLKSCVAEPVIKFRWGVIGKGLVMCGLGVGVCLCVMVHIVD